MILLLTLSYNGVINISSRGGSTIENTTLTKINEAAKIEFLDKGFKDASLRQIVKNAGVTTGAFYGYYKDKLSLFDGLVRDAANGLIDLYKKMSVDYFESAKILSIDNLMDNSVSMLYKFIDYIYLYFDEFKLIFNKSEGTDYAEYLDKLIEYDVKDTMLFIEILKVDGNFKKELSENVIHVLVTAYFKAVIEIVHHEMPKDQSEMFIKNITAFFNSGWRAIFEK